VITELVMLKMRRGIATATGKSQKSCLRVPPRVERSGRIGHGVRPGETAESARGRSFILSRWR